jgi:hypothetical protein
MSLLRKDDFYVRNSAIFFEQSFFPFHHCIVSTYFQSDALYRTVQFTIHDAKRNHVRGLIGNSIKSSRRFTIGMACMHDVHPVLIAATCYHSIMYILLCGP